MFALFQPSRVRGADCSPVARARTAGGQPDLAISLPFWAHCSRWLLLNVNMQQGSALASTRTTWITPSTAARGEENDSPWVPGPCAEFCALPAPSKPGSVQRFLRPALKGSSRVFVYQITRFGSPVFEMARAIHALA